jgi:hypothetical protein
MWPRLPSHLTQKHMRAGKIYLQACRNKVIEQVTERNEKGVLEVVVRRENEKNNNNN